MSPKDLQEWNLLLVLNIKRVILGVGWFLCVIKVNFSFDLLSSFTEEQRF